MIVRIGIKNLFHDPVRAATALAGVAFAVLLGVLQIGILEGASRNASGVIDHAGADVWVLSPNTRKFDFGLSIPERRFYQVLATPGVERAERVAVAWGEWRTPDGRQETVCVVGIEPDAELIGPWGEIEGEPSRIREEGAVVIDQRERERFGSNGHRLELGDTVEINGRRSSVVAFTREIGSFTTIPYLFTSIDNALEYTRDYGIDRVTYVLARAEPGVSSEELAAELRRLPSVDALPAAEFSRRTQRSWIYGTGLGIGLLVTAALGLVVGLVIVGQTIYTMTIEKRREYGTLKALGYSGASLSGIVLVQSAVLGLLGYVLGMFASVAFWRTIRVQGVAIELTPEIAMLAVGFTAALCAFASISSILRLLRMEPAMVFQQ